MSKAIKIILVMLSLVVILALSFGAGCTLGATTSPNADVGLEVSHFLDRMGVELRAQHGLDHLIAELFRPHGASLPDQRLLAFVVVDLTRLQGYPTTP